VNETTHSQAPPKRHAGKILASLFLAAGIALAGVNVEGQSEITTTPTTFTVANGAADAETTASTVRAIDCVGNPTCYVSLLSGTGQGATACVRVELYGPDDAHMGTAYVGTITLASHLVGGTYRPTEAIIATSCRGATSVDVKLIAVSAGTMSVKRWVGTAASGQ
jgi:hypothetical protein